MGKPKINPDAPIRVTFRGKPISEAVKKRIARQTALEKCLGKWTEELPHIDKKMAEDADTLIRSYSEEYPEHEHLFERRPAEWLEAVGGKVKKISVTEHIKTVGLAYALWIWAAHDEYFRKKVLGSFFEKRQRSNPRTTPLHLIVESVIEYGDDTPEGKKDARRLYNRDVQAIRYLEAQGVLPQDVEKLGSQKGEGLNAWARGGKAPPRINTEEPGSDPSPDEDQTSDLPSKPEAPTAAPPTNGAGSPTISPPASDTAAHKGAALGSRVNLIEWRNGSDQPKAVALPDTAQASEFVERVFKLLEDYAEWSAGQPSSRNEGGAGSGSGRDDGASNVVQLTSKVMEHLGLVGEQHGQGLTPKHEVPDMAKRASRFVKDLGDLMGTRPGPANKKREHQEQLASLTEALDASGSTKAKAAIRKAS